MMMNSLFLLSYLIACTEKKPSSEDTTPIKDSDDSQIDSQRDTSGKDSHPNKDTEFPSGDYNISSQPGYLQVSTGVAHTCALDKDRNLVCWGADISGGKDPPPGKGPFLQVTSGNGFSCVIREDQSLYCWGNSSYYGDNSNFVGQFKQVAGGLYSMFALDISGHVIQGYPYTTFSGGPFSSIDAGMVVGCGVLEKDGSISCFPYDIRRVGVTGAQKVSVTWDGYPVEAVCAVLTGGHVRCWNNRDYKGYQLSATLVPYPEFFKEISLGEYHGCGILIGGEAICWGSDNFSRDEDPYAVAPEGIEFTQISTGFNSTCGLDVEGYIYCWGSDYSGVTVPP